MGRKATAPDRLPGTGPAHARIRMYNAGFGDCFLLRLPGTGGRERKVLIDCGKHSLSRCKPPLGEIVQQVLADIAEGEPDGPRVDVLVVTHRHRDHVSGFEDTAWERVTVGEVWMPWTEDPDDDEARAICEAQSRRARSLQAAIPGLKLAATRRENLLQFAANNLTNEKAMALLHGGFRGHPLRRFLPGREEPPAGRHPPRRARCRDRLLTTPHLPGIETYVLGPSRDPAVIRDILPPADEYYEWALGGPACEGRRPTSNPPFADRWCLDAKQYSARYLARGLPDPLEQFKNQRRSGRKTGWKDWARYIGHLGDDPELELAASLESSVNGTSLVLLFRIGRATLLFPGDAQWGTWKAILAEDRWRGLLGSLSFVKIGHHGSENATPKQFVESLLPATAAAMIPTDDVKSWPMIPKASLLENLEKRGVQFVRSDQRLGEDPPGFRRHAPDGYTLYVDVEVRC